MLKSVLSQKDIANLFSVSPASLAPPLLIPLSIAPTRAIPFEVLSLSLLEYPPRYSLLSLRLFFNTILTFERLPHVDECAYTFSTTAATTRRSRPLPKVSFPL